MVNETLKPTFLFAILKSLPILIFSLGLIILAYYFPYLSQYLFLASILPILIIAYNVLLITSRKYIVENEQIIFKRGVFTITEDFLELYRVKDYKVIKSFPFRLINVMKIILDTSDKTHPKFVITGIPKSNITSEIRKLVEINRRARGVREFD